MIFFFSATGNSEYVARRIAHATDDHVSAIDALLAHDELAYEPDADEPLGIVSPTYSWGLPLVVADFLERLELTAQPRYLFFVATYGTTPGQTGRFASEILGRRGIAIDAFFSVKMPDTWTPLFDLSDEGKVAQINDDAEPQIDLIIDQVRAHAAGDFMRDKVPYLVAKPFYHVEYPLMRKTSHFRVDGNCIGCGKCAKGCPVGAIEMRSERPVWTKDRCAACLKCLHRCPKFAIHYGKNTAHHGQYTHPRFRA